MTYKNILSFLKNFVWEILGFGLGGVYLVYRFLFPNKEGSHPLSQFLRKVFEHQQARASWGLVFLTLILLANLYLLPPSTRPKLEPRVVLAAPEAVLLTETTFRKPVKGFLSQGFYWYHQAIDIATNEGEAVYPIADGQVKTVEYSLWGYGHFVMINHPNNYQALYAHLGNILIKPGQEVNKDTVLGYVGMTGRTTGPHLHLEIYEDGKNVNPMELIPGVNPLIAQNQ
ncbi:hypothetical protein COT75_02115 [Candidatus Beckwithbacteria bacterium CG10_big_fil_rev_8_21_14_0_10_34_10]|uniref:M23ase beta-sheet core domain-containing protein n=1 Tax=Candidatus Beckwithbacteria bacterium CG10_big_fil_rev_8_21_14_0_10_34_10 TaxID=1974495 RepID=A0A2H0WBJ8_9BACT|nr:MAG: hypothetical protein COT75_02115 [Candidatus Beckwithbacteria bacterium CG10_big_fil_rev_8_21_14_0_10_34_10]